MGDRRHTIRIDDEELAWLLAMRRAKTCAEKMDFDSETAALRVAIKRTMRHQNPAPRLWPYQCPICQKWHLTSKLPRKPRPPSNGP